MTEQEWLAATDSTPMVTVLRGKSTERKLRLFAVACCQRIRHLLTDKFARNALKIAEQYADGKVAAVKVRLAWGDARRSAQTAYRQGRENAEAVAMWAVAECCSSDTATVLTAVHHAAGCEAYPGNASALTLAQGRQVALLHDIFGNPFRPVVVDPDWLTSTAVALALAIYVDRAFDRLPILADALQDAGCEDEDILAHCRGDGPHVKGCWVVDLVLGKE